MLNKCMERGMVSVCLEHITHHFLQFSFVYDMTVCACVRVCVCVSHDCHMFVVV